MNKPKSIGIIGGAGPLAGSLLFEKIIRLCQSEYGCCRDADFPFIVLWNYPFTEMLKGCAPKQLKAQLTSCFAKFVDLKIELAAIACNTLHAYLPPVPQEIGFVPLIEVPLPQTQRVFALCTKKAASHRLYDCCYPEPGLQQVVDASIDEILAGNNLSAISNRLARSIVDAGLGECTLILGCTELSLLSARAPLVLPGCTLLDPLNSAARQLCRLAFVRE